MALTVDLQVHAPPDSGIVSLIDPPHGHCLACLTQNSQGLEVGQWWLPAEEWAQVCAYSTAAKVVYQFQSPSVLPVKPPAHSSRIKPRNSLHQNYKQKSPAQFNLPLVSFNKEFHTIAISMPSMVQALFQV